MGETGVKEQEMLYPELKKFRDVMSAVTPNPLLVKFHRSFVQNYIKLLLLKQEFNSVRVTPNHDPQLGNYKNGGKVKNHRDPSLVVAKELSRMLDYLDPNLVSALASGTCTLVPGADQGQGVWRSWIKIYMMSGTEVRKDSEVMKILTLSQAI
jgi:hypothetical protein